MGLLSYIRHNLPEAWDVVCRENKIKDKVCKKIYANIPKRYRNRYHTKEAVACVKRLLQSSSIIYAIDDHMDDPAYWSEIQHQINVYLDKCR